MARPIAPAPAPPPVAPPPAPEWPDIVVSARAPLLWRVTKGDAEVILLGSVAPMPLRADWNMMRVRRYLHGARRLLIAPQPRAGLVVMDHWSAGDAAGLFLPRGQDLETILPAALRDRFVAARTRLGQPASRYASLRPAIAGMLLLDDWRQSAGLVTLEPARTLEGLARHEHVAIQRIDPIAEVPTLDALPGLPAPAQQACFARLLANVEDETQLAALQAEAWSDGDIAALKSAYLPPVTCADDIPGDATRRDKAMGDWTRALETALATPGRTFALVDVTDLLAPGGLIARMRANGAEVTVLGL